MSNCVSNSFKLYIPFEFVRICKLNPKKSLFVYKDKANRIYISKHKTRDTFFGSTHIDHENNILFDDNLCKSLNISGSDILAFSVINNRIYLNLIATKK